MWGLEGWSMPMPAPNIFGARTKWRLKAGEQLTLRRRVKFVGGVQWKVYEARLGAEVVGQPTATLAMNLLDRDSTVTHNFFKGQNNVGLVHGFELRLGLVPRRAGRLYRAAMAGVHAHGATPQLTMNALEVALAGSVFAPI